MADNAVVLPKKVRKAVSTVAEKLFVDHQSYAKYQGNDDLRKGNEYITSLPLQMSLYFNVLFFPLWLISTCVTYQAKYTCLDTLYNVVLISLIALMSIIEVIRLYLGYLGNLTEKVPELAGSWLLTILLQLPSSLFLLLNYTATKSMPLEIAMNTIFTIFVLCEIVIGAVALKAMANYQVSLFHIQQFVKAEDMSESPSNEDHLYYGNETRKNQ